MSLTEKIAIITDSCADIPPELAKKHHIFILPMQIICPDGEYRDGIDICTEDIYRRQKTQVLKSSTPSGADVADTFAEIQKRGYTIYMKKIQGGIEEERKLYDKFSLVHLFDYHNKEIYKQKKISTIRYIL